MLDVLRNRRSIRRFEDRPIETADMAALKEAILRAPSSRNIRPCRFLFVTDRALLEQLSRVKPHGASFLAEAGLGIVLCAEESASDVWIEDCAIAGFTVQLAATSRGLGSCWVQVRKRTDAQGRSSEDRVREVLGLEGTLRVDAVIAVGYPAQAKPPVPQEELLWERIVER